MHAFNVVCNLNCVYRDIYSYREYEVMICGIKSIGGAYHYIALCTYVCMYIRSHVYHQYVYVHICTNVLIIPLKLCAFNGNRFALIASTRNLSLIQFKLKANSVNPLSEVV